MFSSISANSTPLYTLYVGPVTAYIRRMKMLSVCTFVLSLISIPTVAAASLLDNSREKELDITSKPDDNSTVISTKLTEFAKKCQQDKRLYGIVTFSFISFVFGTTALFHRFVRPYVIKIELSEALKHSETKLALDPVSKIYITNFGFWGNQKTRPVQLSDISMPDKSKLFKIRVGNQEYHVFPQDEEAEIYQLLSYIRDK